MASGILVIVSVIPYILAIVRRQTKPSKASWIIWALLSAITAGGMYQANALNLQIALVALCDLVIVVLAFKHGTLGWTPVERWSLAGTALGIVLWVSTMNPLYAIIIGLAISTIGSVPTFTKTWNYPDLEDSTAWAIMTISSLLQTIAIPAWTPENALQPIVFLGLSIVMCILIFIRPRRFLVRA